MNYIDNPLGIDEACSILKKAGYHVIAPKRLDENAHFKFWQWKLQVKKLINKWIKNQHWFNDFEDLRSSAIWETGVDIVKHTMKEYFNAGKSPEECYDEIIDIAKETTERM